MNEQKINNIKNEIEQLKAERAKIDQQVEDLQDYELHLFELQRELEEVLDENI